MAQLTIELPDVFMDISPESTKEILMYIVDELPKERVTELLQFALFIKARQTKQTFQIDSYIENIISQPKKMFQTAIPYREAYFFMMIRLNR